MQIGTRVRYGLLAMIDLARRGRAVPARALDIAEAHGLSKGYLEGLLAALRRAGLVRAVRGPGGGWVLARPASRIRALDVFNVLEGTTRLVPCAEDARICPAAGSSPTAGRRCRARTLWVSMGKALEKELRAGTIARLAGGSGRKSRSPGRKAEARNSKKSKGGAKSPRRRKGPRLVKKKTRSDTKAKVVRASAGKKRKLRRSA